MLIKINVTTEHIAKGKPGDCSNCPVALALVDGIPNVTFVLIDGHDIDLCDAKHVHNVATPQEVQEFILNFDRGIKPHLPFSFELEVPEVLCV